MAIVDSKFIQSVHRLDVLAFLKVVNLNTREGFAFAARSISRTADGWLYPLIPLLVSLVAPHKALDLFYVLATAYGIERFFYFTLKKGIKRNRPPVAIPGFKSLVTASDEFSFPSGHTSAAFLTITTLVLFFPGAGLEVLYMWAVSVALSRIILGVHFPLDTVAGAFLGSSTAASVYTIIIV